MRSVADIYTPNLVSFLKAFLSVAGILSCLICFLICYLAVTRSTVVGVFRYYVLNAVIWDTLFVLLLAVWQPAPLFPTLAVYSLGVWRSFGSVGGYLMFVVIVWVLIQIATSLFAIFIFVFFRIVSKSTVRPSLRPNVQLMFQLGSLLAVSIPVYFAAWDGARIEQYFQLYAPRLFFNQDNDFEGLFVFEPTATIYISLHVVAVFIVFLTILAVGLTLASTVCFKKQGNGQQTRLQSRRLNKMFLNLIVWQCLLSVVMLFLPLFTIVTVVAVQTTHGSKITCISMLLASLYPVSHGLMMIFLITPYKRAVVSAVRCVFCNGKAQQPAPGSTSSAFVSRF